jgi:hypothetical protein
MEDITAVSVSWIILWLCSQGAQLVAARALLSSTELVSYAAREIRYRDLMM